MLMLLSPSKTLDFDTPISNKEYSMPLLLNHSEELIQYCKKLTSQHIAELMKISPKLATLNYDRFQQWQPHFTLSNARQAIFAFKGDVYEGLNVEDFGQQDLIFAQQHLQILSGLYGLLKPLDLIQPYRLEMGIKLKNGHHTNLYQFWSDIVTNQLRARLDEQRDNSLINLASNEYFKAVNPPKIKANIITPIFLDESKNDYKIISFYAKKARGLMSRYIIKHQLNQVEDIKTFNLAGYQFDSQLSNNHEWFFKRSAQQAEQYKNR